MTGPADLVEDTWLTTKEAAAYARCSIGTIHRHAAAGTLESTSPGRGRGRRYRREWIREWLAGASARPRRAAS